MHGAVYVYCIHINIFLCVFFLFRCCCFSSWSCVCLSILGNWQAKKCIEPYHSIERSGGARGRAFTHPTPIFFRGAFTFKFKFKFGLTMDFRESFLKATTVQILIPTFVELNFRNCENTTAQWNQQKNVITHKIQWQVCLLFNFYVCLLGFPLSVSIHIPRKPILCFHFGCNAFHFIFEQISLHMVWFGLMITFTAIQMNRILRCPHRCVKCQMIIIYRKTICEHIKSSNDMRWIGDI